MWSLKYTFPALFLLTTAGMSFARTYEDYALYLIHPETPIHVRFLQDLQLHKYIDVLFWTSPNTRNVLLMVNRSDRALFKERMMHFDVKNQMIFESVAKVFEQQKAEELPMHVYRNKFEHYRNLESIYQWLHAMVKRFPQLAKLETIGKTYENRSIYSFNIKRSNTEAFGIIVEAGAHGHEWISTAFATFLIDQLLTSTCGAIARLSGQYHWHIIPVLNPDGYAFAHAEDRLWRKNRRVTNNGKSIGVDLNRNFDYSWGVHDSSPQPDDDNYQGPAPFSELESQALRKLVRRHRDLLLYYFSVHGFGQKFLVPFGDRLEHLENYDQVKSFITNASEIIFKYSGRKYHAGNAFEMLGAKISGDSASWAKYTYGIPYVMTILPRDNGVFGHALPPNQTMPACRELMLAMADLVRTRKEFEDAKVFRYRVDLLKEKLTGVPHSLRSSHHRLEESGLTTVNTPGLLVASFIALALTQN